MKIAIVSDLHIGYERFADDAISQAREALEMANRMADAVILPGDIFDRRAPKPEVIAQAINLFRETSSMRWNARVSEFRSARASFTKAPVVAISGTHERTAEGKDNPLNLLGLAGLLVDTSESTTIIEKGDERVAVYGLGGISEERVKETLARLDPKPVDGLFSIFMFHQSVHEILPFSDEFIHYSDLPKGFDLYVCGHIHSIVRATVHGKPFIIPGSTVLTQLKDGEQEPKGFMILDTESKSCDFVAINSRKMFVEELNFVDAEPGTVKRACDDAIESVLAKEGGRPIIRLKLSGSIAGGFDSADLPLQAVLMRHSKSAIIDIDSSRLKSRDVEKGIEEVRENRTGGASVKELGMRMLGDRLREYGFDGRINPGELFHALASAKKEKALEQALELLER